RAHVNDLALAYQRFHGLPDFVPGALPIDMVHLIDIDRLRLEAAQAIFAVAHDLQRRQTTGIAIGFGLSLAPHGIVDFGSQHDALASLAATGFQPTPDDLLGIPLMRAP